MRILIVDDSRAIHADFRKILVPTGEEEFAAEEARFFGAADEQSSRGLFILDSAYQGEDAVALARTEAAAGQPFSLVFLDVRMPPGWDGIQTARKLWEADPNLEVVLCTAYSDYSWEAIAANLGSRDNLVILKKPFDPCEVLQLAHSLTRKWQLKREAEERFATLEDMVRLRTEQLQQANRELRNDILGREIYESRLAAFCQLNHKLSVAKTIRQAGEAIAEAADELIGWDACTFNLYSAKDDKVRCIFAVDTIKGARQECNFSGDSKPPTAIKKGTLADGPLLASKNRPDAAAEGILSGSDRSPACLMFAPVFNGQEPVGVISVQSHTPDLYSKESLELLRNLASQCGGALARLSAEEALRETQERLSLLLRESPAVLYSTASGDARAPLWVSDNVVKLFGFTAEQCCNPNWWARRIHPDDPNPFSGALAPAEKAAWEYRLRHHDGSYRWVRDQRRQIGRDGRRSEEFVGTWVDINAQKELEDQLRQAQKMEAIGQLAGGVAHDFNNLLAVILGNAELALGAPECSHSGEVVESLKQVVEASQKAANLTRQLLAFSRKQVLHMGPLNLADVLGSLGKMLRRIIGEHIELRCECAPGLPWVQADAGAIEQVLMNLTVNSRDAMPNGGTITIGAQERSFCATSSEERAPSRTGRFVCLQVADNGSGIPPDALPHIFEPFFTTKEFGKGTGLGLATVHGLINQHDGWIEVQSELNKGTTFELFLPAVAEERRPDAAKHLAHRPQGTETILLVEDDESVRKLAARILERSGFTIHLAASGRQALESWSGATQKFDLLLTDVLMPEGISGVDLAEALRKERSDLKVVFMSGYGGEAIRRLEPILGTPSCRLLRKPFQASELVQAIRDTLDGA